MAVSIRQTEVSNVSVGVVDHLEKQHLSISYLRSKQPLTFASMA